MLPDIGTVKSVPGNSVEYMAAGDMDRLNNEVSIFESERMMENCCICCKVPYEYKINDKESQEILDDLRSVKSPSMIAIETQSGCSWCCKPSTQDLFRFSVFV